MRLGVAAGALDQFAQPRRRREYVVVDQRDQLGVGDRGPGVARGILAARRVLHERAHAVAPDHLGRRVTRTVVDHDHLVRLGEVLSGQRVERHVEVAGPVARGDHDGDNRFRHGPQVSLRAVPGSRDIALISLGTTPGLRRADAAFKDAADAAGVSCELITVRVGAAGKLRRQITLTDLVEALASRRAAREVEARVLVFSTVTAALLQRPRTPYAIRFDSPAAVNRPGIPGAWQRAREIRAMRAATALLPWGQAAADAVPAAARTAAPIIPLHVPLDLPDAAGRAPARDIDALAYAGYPEKRGLDVLIRAWAVAGAGRRLVVGGIGQARAEDWLRGRGIGVPETVEWRGLMGRPEWEALLERARVFVNASRREDHGLSQLEALAAGCMLVTVPSAGPYEALPIARGVEPAFVASGIAPGPLAEALRPALRADGADYAARAELELEPYRREAVQRVFEQQVLPALGIR